MFYGLKVFLYVEMCQYAAYDVVVVEVFEEVFRVRLPCGEVGFFSGNLHNVGAAGADDHWHVLYSCVVDGEECGNGFTSGKHDY